MDIIPGPLHPELGVKVSLSKLSTAIDRVYEKYDFILLDTPPWLGGETKGVVKAVEEAVVIGTPSVTGVIEAKRTIKLLEKYKDIRCELLGYGQTYRDMVKLAKTLRLKNVIFHKRFLKYEELPNFIARADICLGIFGKKEKN